MTPETPYSPDQQRVAEWLVNRMNNQVGAGDDPIGFLLASYDHLFEQVSLMKSLHDHCVKFIQSQRITCAETVYQSDRVIVNAYEFIEGVCEIVGYAHTEE
jgi:GTP-dependent phosphoenolpyruvate carboxykinase